MWWRGLDLRFKARSFLTAHQSLGTEPRTAARVRNMESLSNLTPYYTWLGKGPALHTWPGPSQVPDSVRIKYGVCGGGGILVFTRGLGDR